MSSVAAAQVAQYGIENKFIRGEPSTTYFKAVYNRHTNFAIQPMKVNFDTEVSLGTVNTITIPRQGDLIKEITIRMELPAIVPTYVSFSASDNKRQYPVWTNSTPEAIVEKAELVIGGQTIQELTGEMSFIKSELQTPESQYEVLQKITNRYQDTTLDASDKDKFKNLISQGTVFMEMRFYFHKHPSLAIPLVALNKQEVEVRLTLRPLLSLFNAYGWQKHGGGTWVNKDIIDDIDTAAMEPIVFIPFVEYIFLDDMERGQFTSGKQHDYLIEQTQFFQPVVEVDGSGNDIIFTLPFKHLVKELFVNFVQARRSEQHTDEGNQVFNFSKDLNTMQLTLNGETRLRKEVATHYYLQYLQQLSYHTRVTEYDYTVYTYTFATDPESIEPTGSANCNRISKVRMTISPTSGGGGQPREIHVHATSWNVLRICKNTADLLFK